jgi:hypothetical protein
MQDNLSCDHNNVADKEGIDVGTVLPTANPGQKTVEMVFPSIISFA